ncbi:MAG: S9 family peptidase [Candidatus Brocadiae bacterium]|nr:S9 family peptidase [Candidatus Brocadiia bacterium]
MQKNFSIDSLLSSRLSVCPQLYRDRVYFISNLSGVLSLYSMNIAGSFPSPILPLNMSLPNPVFLDGTLPFKILPDMGKILIMCDHDGDELYQPYLLPIYGGIPEPLFPKKFKGESLLLLDLCHKTNTAYFQRDPKRDTEWEMLQANISTKKIKLLGGSCYGNRLFARNADHSLIFFEDFIGFDDRVIYRWDEEKHQRVVFLGTPLEKRGPGYKKQSYISGNITTDNKSIFCVTSYFHDTYSPCIIDIETQEIREIEVAGIENQGEGELEKIRWIGNSDYVLEYNIDGCSYQYLGAMDRNKKIFYVHESICGHDTLRQGVMHSYDLRKETDRYCGIFCFSKAASPLQLYKIEIREGKEYRKITDEKILGIPEDMLSEGEDASYCSFDGTRISSRLYLPSQDLGYEGKRPLILYVHGGPQSQERPDFTWFSMPLIQYFTLNGFAVFVPNARGSTGYGIEYMNKILKNWGGEDRLDHIHGLKMLEKDSRIDSSKRGVVGRSYGGYMTLTLAARHPECFQAACDMFGPYDLLSFYKHSPDSHKAWLDLLVGNPAKSEERKMLIERSPKTYLEKIKCPLMVIQGKNDPRVLESESLELVDQLKKQGKNVDYLCFEDEGHDILKYKNRVMCYQSIIDFFKKHL